MNSFYQFWQLVTETIALIIAPGICMPITIIYVYSITLHKYIEGMQGIQFAFNIHPYQHVVSGYDCSYIIALPSYI